MASDEMLDFAKLVTKLLQSPETSTLFPARLASGKREIVVASEDETLGELFDRIKRLRGPINLAVKYQGQLAVLVLAPSVSAPAGSDEDCPVSKHSPVGMLVALLIAAGHAIRCHLKEPDFEAQLVDQGPRSLVDA